MLGRACCSHRNYITRAPDGYYFLAYTPLSQCTDITRTIPKSLSPSLQSSSASESAVIYCLLFIWCDKSSGYIYEYIATKTSAEFGRGGLQMTNAERCGSTCVGARQGGKRGSRRNLQAWRVYLISISTYLPQVKPRRQHDRDSYRCYRAISPGINAAVIDTILWRSAIESRPLECLKCLKARPWNVSVQLQPQPRQDTNTMAFPLLALLLIIVLSSTRTPLSYAQH